MHHLKRKPRSKKKTKMGEEREKKGGATASSSFFQTFRDDLSLELGVAWFVAFVESVCLTLVIPIFPVALQECEENALLNSVLLTAKAVSQLVAGLALAPLIDTHKVVLIICACVSVALCQVLFVVPALQHSYYAWLAGRILLGASTAPLLAAGLAILQARFKEKEKRARVVGYAMTGCSFGVVVGPILGGALYSASPYAPFAFCAGIALVCLALVFCLRSKRSGAREGEEVVVEKARSCAGGCGSGGKSSNDDGTDVVNAATIVKGVEGAIEEDGQREESPAAETFPLLRILSDTEVVLALAVLVLINADITMVSLVCVCEMCACACVFER